MATISIKTNSKDIIKKLKKTQGGLPIVSSHTVNEAAKFVEFRYKKELNKFTLRNKFTKNAVKLFLSKPRRGSGDFRKIKDINAKVVVRKQKGGKDHYLLDQEIGDTRRGKTKGFVAMPLTSKGKSDARISNSDKKPIKGALRLQKSTTQNLMIAGKDLNTNFNARGGAQRWALMHKYVTGGGRNVGKYGLDQQARKPFFFTGMKRGLGIFIKGAKNRISMIRTLNKKSVKIKATHKFEKSVDRLTPNMMENIFNREAGRFLK